MIGDELFNILKGHLGQPTKIELPWPISSNALHGIKTSETPDPFRRFNNAQEFRKKRQAVYLTKQTRRYMQNAMDLALEREYYKIKKFKKAGVFAFIVAYPPDDKRTRDNHNQLKLAFDTLQQIGIVERDSQIKNHVQVDGGRCGQGRLEMFLFDCTGHECRP